MAAPALALSIVANIEQVRQAMAQTTSTITTTTGAMSKLVSSFSGDEMLRKANAMTAAVDQIGGAAKLTEANQAKVNVAVTQAIEQYQLLGRIAPPAMVELANATKQTSTFTQELKENLAGITTGGDSIVGHISQMALGFVSAQAAMGLVEQAGHKVVDVLGESVTAAMDADRIERQLTQALQDQGVNVPKVAAQYRALAERYEETTTFSHTLIESTEALLTQMGGVMPAQMDRALQAVTDLATGMAVMTGGQVDLEAAARLVSKGFEDNFTAFKRYGIEIDTAKANALGMDYVLGQIEQRFGGQAQADAQSYAGQIKQLGNQFEDLEETLGGAITKTGLGAAAIGYAKVQVIELQSLIADAMAAAALLDPIGFGGGGKAPQRSDINLPLGGANTPPDFVAQLAKAKEALDALTPSMQAQIAAALQVEGSAEKVAESLKLDVTVVDLYKQQLQQQAEASKKAAEAVDAHNKKIADQVAIMSGAKLAQDIQDNSDILAGATNKRPLSPQAIEKELSDLKAFLAQGGQLTDLQKQFIVLHGSFIQLTGEQNKMIDDFNDKTDGMVFAFEHVDNSLNSLIATGKTYEQVMKNLPGTNVLPQMLHDDDALRKAADDAEKAWTQMFGRVESAVSDDFAKMLTGAESFKDGFIAVWHDIENEITSVLSSLLKKFIDGFLRGIVGAMQGQQGAFSQAFSGILSGGAGTRLVGSGTTGTPGMPGGPGTGLTFGFNASRTATGTALGAAAGAGVGIAVGYSVGSATGSEPKGALAGAASGAAMGAMYGGYIGAGVGALAGAIAGYVAALKQHEKANDDRDTFVASMLKQYGSGQYSGYTGGMGQIGQQLQAAGRTDLFKSLVDANTDAKAQAVIQQINDVLAQQQQLVDSITSSYKTLESQATSMGATMPADFDDITAALLKAGNTKLAQQGFSQLSDAVAKYQGLLNDQADFQRTQQEMSALGLTAADMGAKFNQMNDEASARDIAQSWADLSPLVADVNGLADKYLDQMNQMVKNSQTMGTAIPESMKPIDQILINQGLLLAANGDKITDLGQLNFEQDPLAKGLGDLNKTLEDIRDLLAKGLPDAAGTAQKAIDGLHGTTIPIVFDAHNMPAPGDSSDDGPPPPAMASGGYVYPRPGGTIVRLGEGGQGEFVVPASMMGGSSASAPQVVVNVNAPGAIFRSRNDMEQLGKEILPYVAKAAQGFQLTRPR